MEKHKGLLVILSVAGLMAVLILVGIVFFYPRPQEPVITGTTNNTTGTTQDPPVFDAIDWVRATQTNTIPLQDPVKPDDSPFQITLSTDPVTAVEVGSGKTPDSQVETPTTVVNTVTPVTPPKTTTTVAVSEKKPAPVTVRVKEFWIQVGAFKDRFQADLVLQKLAGTNLKGIITTAQSQGTTWYRVRIGPYATKAEADKFLEWVKPLQGLENSYVSEVTAVKQK